MEPEPFMQGFGPHGRFMTNALRRFSRDDLLARMREWGVPCDAEDGFHYSPRSRRASDLRFVLESQMRSRGVQVRTDTAATALDGTSLRGILTDAGPLEADAVVLATDRHLLFRRGWSVPDQV
jgi:predicted flavoprotein YhiN